MTTTSFVSGPAASVVTGVLVVPVFEGPEPGPGVKETRTLEAYTAAKLTGKKGEQLLVTKRRGERFAAGAVLLLGVGKKDELTVDAARRALGRVAGSLARFGTVATTFPLAFGEKDAAEAVAAAAEGLLLGSYRFTRYKSAPEGPEITGVTVVGSSRWDAKAMKASVRRAAVVCEAVRWARDLVNTPAGDMPPAQIAKEAQAMARAAGLTCKVWTEAQLAKGGFGGILGVGKGSVNPPRMIELEYRGAGRATPIALTGKGIAFDSGGLSLKDPKSMETMKDDMGGAASIMATMKVLAALKPKINVIAAIPCSENMPSGSAQKPGDVIRHYGGKTSEVLNTDAEGRLVLADALAFLAEKKPAALIDTATLTGSCMIALGTDIAGGFSNDPALLDELVAAGRETGEVIWPMPLHRDYRRIIDSSIADVKNTGERYGGAITAALFLAEFAGDTPWVHLDIAGPGFSDGGNDLGPRGGTGVPVRTLVGWVLARAATAAATKPKPKPRAAAKKVAAARRGR